jgi:hypothetical protein
MRGLQSHEENIFWPNGNISKRLKTLPIWPGLLHPSNTDVPTEDRSADYPSLYLFT